MSRRRPAPGLALAVAALAVLTCVGACSASSAGPPATHGSPGSGAGDLALFQTRVPGPARTALGDLSTLDPCSLVDLAGFKRLGDATYGDPQSMDYCVVLVQSADGPQEVHVGEVVQATADADGAGAITPAGGGPALRGSTKLPGGQLLVTGGLGEPTCQDELVFTDQLGLLASGRPPEGAPTSQVTCDAATAAVAGALTSIAAGRVAHRTFPARSFGPVDPCTVLTQAAVARLLPALGSAPAVSHPARHQCEFGSRSATTTYAALVLGAAYQRFDGGPTSTTLTVHGHQVVLIPTQPTGRPAECTGYGPHIPYPSRSGMPAMEMAELHVSLPDGAAEDAACHEVAVLAQAVFSHLP